MDMDKAADKLIREACWELIKERETLIALLKEMLVFVIENVSDYERDSCGWEERMEVIKKAKQLLGE